MAATADLGPSYQIYLPLNQTTSYKFSKKVHHIKEVQYRSCRVRIEIKHRYPCFIAE